MRDQFTIRGIPQNVDPTETALLRTRMLSAASTFKSTAGLQSGLTLVVSDEGQTAPAGPASRGDTGTESGTDRDTLSLKERASYYKPIDPLYGIDALVLPQGAFDRLLRAVATVELRKEIFDEWNLRAIEPHPSVALNFHGEPGTGKTLAAHAIADRLGRKLICTKYSQLESKYHGEGPKNLDALFHAAREHDAVLFLDEADSLMSRRFESVSQGSEQAINSMRSELLQSLDSFDGIVIFASNFVESYDEAFDSRVRHVHFPQPDRQARREIWRRMLVPGLPLAEDVSVDGLADMDDVSGRDIRSAVIEAATEARLHDRPRLDQASLVEAVQNVKRERIVRKRLKGVPVEKGSEEEKRLQQAALRALASPSAESESQEDLK